jgi:murein DD-endopeptidase MepM/ murein hydrolase activator NlpD
MRVQVMRSFKSDHRVAALNRGIALIFLGFLAAGCSSGVSRFADLQMFANSTANQRTVLESVEQQPYSGDAIEPATTDGAYTGSVSREALKSVSVREADPVDTRTGETQAILRNGETIYGLSRRFGVPAKTILEVNNIEDPTAVTAGSKVVIPARVQSGNASVSEPDNHPEMASAGSARGEKADENTNKSPRPTPAPDRVAVLPTTAGTGDRGTAAGTPPQAVGKSRKTDRLPRHNTPPPKKADEVIEQEKADFGNTPGDSGIGKMRWPARGRIVSEFGKMESGRRNEGVDIALPSGSTVKAAENGVVIYAGDGLTEFGNTVLIRHENGVVTIYGHASSLSVKRGDTVKRGQEIARSGMSGSADAPKLHFEVREKSVPVDPLTYLR